MMQSSSASHVNPSNPIPNSPAINSGSASSSFPSLTINLTLSPSNQPSLYPSLSYLPPFCWQSYVPPSCILLHRSSMYHCNTNHFLCTLHFLPSSMYCCNTNHFLYTLHFLQLPLSPIIVVRVSLLCVS